MSESQGLEFTVEGGSDFAFANVKIPAGDTLKVEASSMATMSTNLKMKTKMKGGFSRLFAGENIFINEFTAEGGSGEIGIAPGAPGDLTHYYVEQGEGIYLQSGSFVASQMGVELDLKWQGMKGFFNGEGLFLARCTGTGDLWFNTFGGLIEVEVDGDHVVDTGHIVAFEESLSYSVESVGGLKSLFFSGEGLVCRFRGKGKIWTQTRQFSPFGSWTFPYRPVKKSN
jgi:uncharacterized protein (TIGR00266 family)